MNSLKSTEQIFAARIRELLDYDSTTGIFTWRVGRSGLACKGSIAGTTCSKGYIKIRVDGSTYKAHRLAWLYFYGAWPSKDLDHINQKKLDNRISNLREVSASQNNQNKTKRKDNTSGYRGVSRHKRGNQWQARIKIQGKEHYLGLFDSSIEASHAYEAAAKQLHTHRPII